MTSKIRCRDCRSYEHERCEAKMKYRNPDVLRYCLHYEPKEQQILEIWQMHPSHGWPP